MNTTICLQSCGPHTYTPTVWPGHEAAKSSGSCFSPLGEFERYEGESDRDFLQRISTEQGWPREGDLADF